MMLSNLTEPVEIDIELVKEAAEEMGKSNIQYNTYAAVLKLCDVYSKEGLTPKIFADPLTGKMGVFTKERIENSLH